MDDKMNLDRENGPIPGISPGAHTFADSLNRHIYCGGDIPVMFMNTIFYSTSTRIIQ